MEFEVDEAEEDVDEEEDSVVVKAALVEIVEQPHGSIVSKCFVFSLSGLKMKIIYFLSRLRIEKSYQITSRFDFLSE